MVTLDLHVGEMDVEEVEETLTHPETRIIKQITVEDDHAADVIFEQMMGKATVYRKQLLKEHGHEATYNQE